MKRYIKIFCILFFLLFAFIDAKGQTSYTNLNTRIEFIINTNTIIHNSEYNYYINTIIPELRNNIDNLDRILLVGSASPEGNKNANIRLANIRADKIYSYISSFILRNKIEINNDYDLFLSKTGLDESDYQKLRATYIEVIFKETNKEEVKVDTLIKEHFYEKEIQKVDTLYIKDTLKIEKRDTVYLSQKEETKDKLVFSLYNNLIGDLLIRPNIGVEFYFNKFSFFIEGSFSDGKFFGKNYDIDFWHTGFRKYFNDNYNKLFIEVYGRTGYFDTELLSKDDNGLFGICFGGGIGLGYKFNVCSHWKITPMIRIGFDDFKFNNYYTTNNGTVNVSFDDYVDGRKLNNIENNISVVDNTENKIYINKTINKNFFDNSYNMYWFGPTYVGIIIQRDFYIHKYYKTNKKR